MRNNILSREIPKEIIKTGTLIIWLGAFSVLSTILLIKLPEKLYGEAVLTTEVPSVSLKPRTSGKVQHIFKQDGDFVKKGDDIALIESDGKYNHILLLEKLVLDNRMNPYIVDTLVLGEVRTLFENYLNNIQQKERGQTEVFTGKKIVELQKELFEIQQSNDLLQAKKESTKKEVDLLRTNLNRQKKLNMKGVISDLELEKVQSYTLKGIQSLNDVELSINTNKLKISQLQKELLIVQEGKSNQSFKNEIDGSKYYNALLEGIHSWKQKFIISAPINGRVTMRQRINQNEHIETSQIFCDLMPSKNKILGLGYLPPTGIGKISASSDPEVIIKLSNYPYKEFGVLSGKIKNLSPIARLDGMYEIEIDLNQNLTTSYGFNVLYIPEMQGSLEIVLEKKSLGSRLLDELRNIYSQIH